MAKYIGPKCAPRRLYTFASAFRFEMEAILTSCGFDQKGPARRRERWKYRHIPTPSLLALGLFASNLECAAYGFTP